MNDLKLILRQLAKSPGFTTVAIVTLALGLGACVTTFSLVHAVVLKPLPFDQPERLVWIQNWANGSFSDQASRMDNYLDWKTQTDSFSDIAGFSPFHDVERTILAGEGAPRRLFGVQTTHNFLDVLGVELLRGRSFTAEECLPNGRKAAIISHSFWRDHFDRSSEAIGTPLSINGAPVEVVGILPQNSSIDLVVSPGSSPDILLPLPETGKILNWGNVVIGVGRLKDGVSQGQAQEEMRAHAARILVEDPERAGFSPETGAALIPLNDYIRGGFRNVFFMITAAVLLVWLVACINLSNLLLARADRRRQEFSLRAALGATRARLIRQTLSENLLLALGGCGIGTLLASYSIAFITRLDVFDVPLLKTSELNVVVLTVAVGMALLSAILCSVFPAWRLWQFEAPRLALHSGSRGTAGMESARFRRGLVITELALACVLLVGAGLLTRSFANVVGLDVGFESESLYSWEIDTSREFSSNDARNAYFDGLRDRVAQVAGIESVGLSDSVPLGFKRHWPLDAQGVVYQTGDYRGGYVRFVDDHCLRTMKIPIIRGRNFSPTDRIGAEPVILISETLAQRAWKGEDPLGRMVLVSGQQEYRVVGIVGDIAHAMDAAAQSDFYLRLEQWERNFWMAPNLVIRSSSPRSQLFEDVRAAIRAFDPALPANEFIHLADTIDRAVAPRRLIMGILVCFALSALLLVAVGIYGLIAYHVGTQTKEFGIRFAIGAQRHDVFWMVIRSVLRIFVIGLLIGLGGALVGTRLLENQLFGITAGDPITYLAAMILIGVIALVAAWVPARRAANVQLTEALRITT